uniref:Ubiquinol-cytochrome c reductase complex assembly factor 6 n=2 Tax=Rhinopithecus TaxID=542827 RepID=A0A2K6KUD0_RHIBE
MPAGVPMSTYLKMFTASLLAMFAGAEVVHRYYRPDLVKLEGLGRVKQRRP